LSWLFDTLRSLTAAVVLMLPHRQYCWISTRLGEPLRGTWFFTVTRNRRHASHHDIVITQWELRGCDFHINSLVFVVSFARSSLRCAQKAISMPTSPFNPPVSVNRQPTVAASTTLTSATRIPNTQQNTSHASNGRSSRSPRSSFSCFLLSPSSKAARVAASPDPSPPLLPSNQQ